MESTERTLITRVWAFYRSKPITRVLTACYVKLTQSTALEQKRFDLRSLSPALRNLCLLRVTPLVTFRLITNWLYNKMHIIQMESGVGYNKKTAKKISVLNLLYCFELFLKF